MTDNPKQLSVRAIEMVVELESIRHRMRFDFATGSEEEIAAIDEAHEALTKLAGFALLRERRNETLDALEGIKR